jgi:hypothetical protein
LLEPTQHVSVELDRDLITLAFGLFGLKEDIIYLLLVSG